MKITITVDEAVFDKEIENKFSDFFNRVITDIKYPDVVQGLCGNYEYETADMLKNAFYAAKYNEETDTDKHWEECRQIALYDDELRKAMNLLSRVKAVHAAAIRNGDAVVSSLTSRLLHDIEKLEKEISDSERRIDNG
jgi:hypothetical protein